MSPTWIAHALVALAWQLESEGAGLAHKLQEGSEPVSRGLRQCRGREPRLRIPASGSVQENVAMALVSPGLGGGGAVLTL